MTSNNDFETPSFNRWEQSRRRTPQRGAFHAENGHIIRSNVISVLAYCMGGGTQQEHVQSGTGATIKSPEPSDGKRRLVRGEGLVARISNVYRPQLPMITKDIPELVVPYYVVTAWLDEPADTRKRSW